MINSNKETIPIEIEEYENKRTNRQLEEAVEVYKEYYNTFKIFCNKKEKVNFKFSIKKILINKKIKTPIKKCFYFYLKSISSS